LNKSVYTCAILTASAGLHFSPSTIALPSPMGAGVTTPRHVSNRPTTVRASASQVDTLVDTEDPESSEVIDLEDGVVYQFVDVCSPLLMQSSCYLAQEEYFMATVS